MSIDGANFEIWIGENIAMTLLCTDDENVAQNLTGYTAQGVLKASTRDSTVVLNLSPTIPTPANGTVVINVSTEGLSPGVFGYDVQLSNNSDVPIVIAYGTIKLRRKNTPNL
jgi:hypothetical protein